MKGKLRRFNPLQAPFIKVRTKVVMPGMTNGVPNIKYDEKYVIAPSGKKIATYIVNQIFGSDLVTQTEGLNVGWLMPTLKEGLEQCIYDKECFIYLHKFENKVYLECINKNYIFNLDQVYDKVRSCDIIQDFDEINDKTDYSLKRHIEIKDGKSVVTFEAFEKDKKATDWKKISLDRFNKITGNEFMPMYNLPYETIVNIDIGQEFFKDSEKLLNEEMVIINTIADEIEKTKTRIVTTEHYQSTDISSSWKPQSTHYDVKTLSVNNMADYFTLLPGDKDHQMFEFLQGNIRIQEYENTFKFYDYQVIQMSGLSPSSFGYEKDAYQNKENVSLSANASEMTIEAIKTQIEAQINNLIANIVKLQQSQNIKINELPIDLQWDYGSNERFDDMKKLKVLGAIQKTTRIPYSVRAKIIVPILNKLIDDGVDEDRVNELVEEYGDEKVDIEFGEI